MSMVQEELRTVSFGIYPKLWNELEIAIDREYGRYKKRRTDIMTDLVQGYINTNSAFLYPEGTVMDRMSLKEVETERKKIASIVEELIKKMGEKKKTTMQVPTSLWSNFHVVTKRKFGLAVAVNDIILMLLSDYLERKKKFLSPQPQEEKKKPS